MTRLRQGTRLLGPLRAARDSVLDASAVFLRDVGQGLLEVSHNSLALVGLVVVGTVLIAGGRTDLRHAVEEHALSWLQERQDARTEPDVLLARELAEEDAVKRATAADPKELTRQQAAVAHWIARRYRVAPEPISRLVKEAWQVGKRAGIDPTVILAVMAVESSFNPFAQSSVGAQGLMQVMTRVHDDKYEAFGGTHAAFDPVTNLRVGVQVLKECIARAGSLEAGLRYYVGAANLPEDGGYADKVLGARHQLLQVANGKPISPHAPARPLIKASSNAPQVVIKVRSTTDEAQPQPALHKDSTNSQAPDGPDGTPASERYALLR